MTDTITLPRAQYDAMLQQIEDLNDIAAAHAARTGATLPHDFAMRIIDGEHPIRVWRDYRNLSASDLAKTAQISNAYLSEIETGKKPGSVTAYKAIAIALRVPVDAILP